MPGGDSGCDIDPDQLHGLAESTVPVSQSVLGGVNSLFYHTTSALRQRRRRQDTGLLLKTQIDN